MKTYAYKVRELLFDGECTDEQWKYTKDLISDMWQRGLVTVFTKEKKGVRILSIGYRQRHKIDLEDLKILTDSVSDACRGSGWDLPHKYAGFKDRLPTKSEETKLKNWHSGLE